jgi:RNA polymerase sigma factor (sigma-70 family)
MRSRFDSQDFVHDVWASFFANPPRDARFEDPKALIGYLERMAEYKIGEEARRQGTLKNDVQREQPLDDPDLIGGQPTPSQIVGVEDEWEHLVRCQSPLHQNILRLVRHGMTYHEIAARLNTTEKTIRRLLRRLDPRDNDA